MSVSVEIVAKATLVLVAAIGVHALMSRASAAFRHLVWTTALLAIVVMPLVIVCGPVWRVPVLSPTWAARLQVLPTLLGEPHPRPRQGQAVVSQTSNSVTLADVPTATLAPERTTERITKDGPRHPVASTWPLLIVIGWAVGFVIALCRLGIGFVKVSWIVRRAPRVVDPTWLAMVADAASALRVGRDVTVVVSDRTSVPVAFGLTQPALLLPVDAERWNADRLRVVLLHELAHVRRHDCAVQTLAQVARALYWFHPLAHMAVARLRFAQEGACDDLVLGTGTTRASYARHMVEMAVEMAAAVDTTTLPESVGVAMVKPSHLEERVMAILDCSRSRRASSVGVCAIAAAIACLWVLPISAFRPVAVDTTRGLHQGNRHNDVSLAVRSAGEVAGELNASTIIVVAGGPDVRANVRATMRERLGRAPVRAIRQGASDSARPNFSGTWTRDAIRSQSTRAVPFYMRRDYTLTIVQTSSTLGLGYESFSLDGAEDRTTAVDQDLGTFFTTTSSSWHGPKLVTVKTSLWERPDPRTGELRRTTQFRRVKVFSLTSHGTEMIIESLRPDDGLAFDGDLRRSYSWIADRFTKVSP